MLFSHQLKWILFLGSVSEYLFTSIMISGQFKYISVNVEMVASFFLTVQS
jgi:hypothetical protein